MISSFVGSLARRTHPKGPTVYRSPLLATFAFGHLPPTMQEASRPFSIVAEEINARFAQPFAAWLELEGRGPGVDLQNPAVLALPAPLRLALVQTEQALADLLRAKDCAVRVVVALRTAG